ncbi:MAG: glycine zipper domain-containing protein [Burkholderiaceae bacterium]
MLSRFPSRPGFTFSSFHRECAMETITSTTAHAGTLHLPKTPAAGTNEAFEAANSSHAEVDRAAQEIQETVERVAAKAAAMADGVADATDDSQSPQVAKFNDLMSSEWAESARNEVREHPLAVVGIALVVGLVIGRL